MTTGWLIEESTLRDVERAMRAADGIKTGELSAAHERIAAQVDAARERGGGVSYQPGAGDTARINVVGALTPTWNPILSMFGVVHTPWPDICESIAAAEADKRVSRVEFVVNSPGGSIDGMFDTLAAIEGMKKPRGVVAARACSAAYALAAVAGDIRAASPAAEFGSVGIVAEMRVSDDVVSITSTDAPDKRPDPKTEEGRATIRAYLDQLHGLFAEAIAKGRRVTVEKVNADFGRGATMLAGMAKERGMIDAVASSPLFDKPRRVSAEGAPGGEPIAGARLGAFTSRAEGGTSPALTSPAPTVAAEDNDTKATEEAAKGTHMDLKTLKAQHPDVYEAAFSEGQSSERKRSAAHAKMAANPGCNDVALKAIIEGKAFADDEVQADYLSARMNARDIKARQDDDAGVEAAVGGAKKGASDEPKPLHESAIAEFLGKKGA